MKKVKKAPTQSSKGYKHVKQDERALIELLVADGQSPTEIAEKLGRNKSTISREIARNKTEAPDGKFVYKASNASAFSEKRRTVTKLLNANKKLREDVFHRLTLSQSPEQIANVIFNSNGEKMVSDETIYRYIFSPENSDLKLWNDLRWRKCPKRVKRGVRGKKQSKIPDRISIHERSSKANDRDEFGHWEGDLVVFKRPNPMCLLVLRERLTRFTLAQVCPNRTAPVITKAVLTALSGLPLEAMKSMTLDNDLSFVEHILWRDKFAMKTYFCDPYSSWQKGAVEQVNLLLREDFPRNVALEYLVQSNLDNWTGLINERPTKCLGYKTPRSVFLEFIRSLE